MLETYCLSAVCSMSRGLTKSLAKGRKCTLTASLAVGKFSGTGWDKQRKNVKRDLAHATTISVFLWGRLLVISGRTDLSALLHDQAAKEDCNFVPRKARRY